MSVDFLIWHRLTLACAGGGGDGGGGWYRKQLEKK